ncbi:MAG TPA: hypothetical protein VHN37_02070 [Actinomycetota bacterium]|nr:hypothetical protein [Actinomycetota bacterium]
MRPEAKHRLFVRIALSAALVAGTFVAGSSAALADCGETVYVDAYDVELEPRRKTYRIGDTAVFDGAVTRTDTGMPVSEASFFVYIPPTRKGFVVGWSKTDGDGEAVLKMKLRKGDVETGPATVVGRAQQERADATCAQVVEYGEIELQPAFRIKK